MSRYLFTLAATFALTALAAGIAFLLNAEAAWVISVGLLAYTIGDRT